MDEEEMIPTEPVVEEQAPETPVETTETPVETPEEVVPEVPARHPLYDKIASKYTDREFASDDDYLNAAYEMFGELEGYRTQNETHNSNIIDAFMAEPDLAAVMIDVTKGYSMLQALARNVDPAELQEAIDLGDDELKQSVAERQKKKAEMDAFLAEINGNIEASKAEVDNFMQSTGWSQEKTTDFLNKANEFFSDVYKGKVTAATLEKVRRMIDYETDVADAAETGEIRGRNANIETQIEKEEKAVGDGLPAIASAAAVEKPKDAPAKSGLEDILENQKKRTVF